MGRKIITKSTVATKNNHQKPAQIEVLEVENCPKCKIALSKKYSYCPHCGELVRRVGAGFWIRFLARVIDTAYLSVFLAGIATILSILIILLISPKEISTRAIKLIISKNFSLNFYALFGYIFYFVIMEGAYGSTLGKLICRLKVVTVDGKPCSFGNAVKRSLGFFIDQMFLGLVGIITLINSPLKQRVGDLIAKTMVIRSSRDNKQAYGKFVISLLVASMVYITIIALTVIINNT